MSHTDSTGPPLERSAASHTQSSDDLRPHVAIRVMVAAAPHNPNSETNLERLPNQRPTEDFPSPPPYQPPPPYEASGLVSEEQPPPYEPDASVSDRQPPHYGFGAFASERESLPYLAISGDTQQNLHQPRPMPGFSYGEPSHPSEHMDQHMNPRQEIFRSNASEYRPVPYDGAGAAPRMPQMPGPPGGWLYRPTTWEQHRFDEEEAAVWYGFGGTRPTMPMPPPLPATPRQWDFRAMPSTSPPPERPFRPLPLPPPHAFGQAFGQRATAAGGQRQQQQEAGVGSTSSQHRIDPSAVRQFMEESGLFPELFPTEQREYADTPEQQQPPSLQTRTSTPEEGTPTTRDQGGPGPGAAFGWSHQDSKS